MRSTSTYRQILQWTLLFVYILGAMKPLFPFVEYKVNYKYISEVLCENKENTEMHCDGKCHLAKELKKAAKEESQKSKALSKLAETETLPEKEISFAFVPARLIKEITYATYIPSPISNTQEKTSPPPRA